MRRGLKKIFVIVLILFLIVSIFNCVKKLLITNIFDEMYFGTNDILGGHLTSASWNNTGGLAKTIDSVKYAVPDNIHIGFSDRVLADNENFAVTWEIDKKRLLFVYSVSLPISYPVVSAIMNIYYFPFQKRLEIHPLHVASSNNILGDTSRETIDSFFKMYGSSETAYYMRAKEVFKTVLIDNWRLGNPTSLFQDTLGKFEPVYKEVEN